MPIEKTFSIIKPEAVKNKISGKIISMFEDNGFTILAQKKISMTQDQARHFYAVHKDRPFYNDLVKFMTSGPVIVQVLEKENAIADNRSLMGATNPSEAAEGTIRKDYGTNVEANAVHGSDAPDTAQSEIAFFFSGLEFTG